MVERRDGYSLAAICGNLGGNIGHSFMVHGVNLALKNALGKDSRSDFYENHRPLSTLPVYRPQRYIHSLRGRLGNSVIGKFSSDHLIEYVWSNSRDLSRYEVAIFCGGPAIQRDPSAAISLILKGQLGSFAHQGIPTLALGLGSGGYALQGLSSASAGLTEHARNLYKSVADFGSITVRDQYAHDLLGCAGISSELLPCPASLTGKEIQGLREQRSDFPRLLINYQYWGGNEPWGQNIDPGNWSNQIQNIVRRVSSNVEVAFLAHNNYESKLARHLDLGVPIYQPKTLKDYARLTSSACGAITNRIHAAIPIAAAGVPVYAVGVDTRLMSTELVGAQTVSVWDVNSNEILSWINSLESRNPHQNLMGIQARDGAMTRYTELIRSATTFGRAGCTTSS